jgi:hypothetical protein
MPIRINLLAEEQYLAEMRRKDPVKRAAYLGGFLAVLALGWWGWLLYVKGEAKQALANSNTEKQNLKFCQSIKPTTKTHGGYTRKKRELLTT